MGGIFGGGGQQTPAYSTQPGGYPTAASYIPNAQPQADQSLQNLFGQLGLQSGSLYGNNSIWPSSIYGNAANTISSLQPYLSGAIGNAGNNYNALQGALNYYIPGATGQGQAAQQALLGTGQTMGNEAGALQGATQQVINQAFDPNQAQYQDLQNQAAQQSAAGAAFSGLTGTPYAQGLANDAQDTLAINWQNNLLNNQIQGLNAGASGFNNASNLATQGANAVNQSGLLPAQDVSSLYNSLLGSQGTALSQLYGAGNQNLSSLGNLAGLGSGYQTQLENALQSYLGLGQSAAQLAGNLGNQAFNQNQTGLGNIIGAAGLGSNLLLGGGGLSGALGLGSSGLLGSAGGTALDTGTDFAGGAGSGLLGLLTGGKA